MAATFFAAEVSDQGVTNTGTITWPASTAAGMSAVILLVCFNSTCALTGTGWTNDVPNELLSSAGDDFYWGLWSKASLTSSDISSPPTFSGTQYGGYGVLIVQNASAIAFLGSATDQSGPTISLTGTAPGANASLIASILNLYQKAAQVTPVQPTSFTLETGGGNVGSARENIEFACITDASFPGYPTSWTSLNAGNVGAQAMYEFDSSVATFDMNSQGMMMLP